MRMKFIRSLPLMWARTRCPFSSSTANIVFGSGSTTVPSTSIASFFATGTSSFSSLFAFATRAKPSPAAHEPKSYQMPRRAATGGSDRREDRRPLVRDGDGVLEMGGERAVARRDGPAVALDVDVVPAEGQHRLDREADARLEPDPLRARAVVGHLWVLVHLGADPMSDEVPDDPVGT